MTNTCVNHCGLIPEHVRGPGWAGKEEAGEGGMNRAVGMLTPFGLPPGAPGPQLSHQHLHVAPLDLEYSKSIWTRSELPACSAQSEAPGLDQLWEPLLLQGRGLGGQWGSGMSPSSITHVS